jgi:hypothetical protein
MTEQHLDPAEMDDQELLRAFGAQKARLLAADEAVAALAFPSEAEAARSAAYATAQLEAARLRPLGLEMRRRFHARVEVEAAGLDAEISDFLDGAG